MPKVIHIFKTYFPDTQGGLEEAIRQIGKCIIKKGFDVEVITVSKKPGEQILDGITVRSFKHSFGISTMPISLSLIENFKSIIAESDIIHLHYPYPIGELLTLFSKINKPIVLTFHAEILGRGIVGKLYEPFTKALFKKVDQIVPTSSNLLLSTNVLNSFREKSIPINLWLDTDRFENLPDVDAEYKEKIHRYGEYALFVGVLRWYKGLDVLLDAARDIKQTILIVGKGPEKKHLETRIRNENIDNVKLLGYLTDDKVAYLFKNSSFFVLPSQTRGECFGQVLLESSYYHKPMISTELGTGTSYVNIDGLTGYVVAPNNSEELSSKMNILFNDTQLCHRLGNNAYKRYLETFTEEIQGEKYVDLYESLLKK